jgi:OOP family OmpA-OmpF porin
MFAKIGSLVAAIAFPLLCLNCISTDSLQIATLLRGTVASSLKAANIGGVDVKADGRDIILNGTVPSEDIKTKAGALAMALPGVRTVDNELVVGGDVKVIQSQLDKILLDKKIEFESGKDVILPASTPVLQQVLDVLTKYPQLSVTINGHTDNSGDAGANRTLSQARAQAVVGWLSQHGVAANRMKAAGFGPDKPIATNATPEGRAQNRRVEIIANQ